MAQLLRQNISVTSFNSSLSIALLRTEFKSSEYLCLDLIREGGGDMNGEMEHMAHVQKG